MNSQLFPNFATDRILTQRLSATIATKTLDFDLTANDFCIIVDAIAQNITITLHLNTSNWYRIKKSDRSTFQVSITTSNGKTIEDEQTLVIISPGDSVDLMLDDSGNWKIF